MKIIEVRYKIKIKAKVLTFYGLSALQQDLRPPLAIAVSGATKIEVVKNKEGKEEYLPNPFTVTAYIQNIGTGTAVNSKVKINLPKGMEVIGGNNVISLGNLPVGTKQHQVSWKVKISPSSVEKIEKYSVTVQADNAAAKTLEREISIPKILAESLQVRLDTDKIVNSNNVSLQLEVLNTGVTAVDANDLKIMYYFKDNGSVPDVLQAQSYGSQIEKKILVNGYPLMI